MAIDKILVVVELTDAGPTATSLELLTAARSLATSVEAITWGSGTAAAAAVVGSYGATTLHDVGDLAGSLPGVPVAGAIATLVGSLSSSAILIPTSYDGRDIAGRLSAKLNLPVLTNITGLNDNGTLSTEHPIFGGTQIVHASFTGSGPGIFVVRAKIGRAHV